ncbi:MAG: sensor histidine kinase [Anaerolineaceae bacterium]|nr:sensor histidine kinase [Anaerolineaceae bacterium]
MLQFAVYAVVFIVLVDFIIDHPDNLPQWKFFGTVLALSLLLLMNILFAYPSRLSYLYPLAARQWIALFISAFLIFSAIWMGGQFNAVYLIFMLCAQAAIERGIWPSGVVFSVSILTILLAIYKSFGATTNDMISLASSTVAGILFVMLLAVLLIRYARQTERAERLLNELQAANTELETARQKEKELAIAEERVRLARDIHDGLGHHLTVLSIQLQAASKLVTRDPQAAAEAIQACRTEAQAALEEVRSSVSVMRQSPIELQPLGEALESLVKNFEQLTGTPVRLQQQETPVQLSPFARQTLYRAIQESLTNVQKHGQRVRQVTVNLEVDADCIRLKIVNDGNEPKETAVNQPGFGLNGLRERVSQLDGTLSSGRIVSGGYQIEIMIPLREADHDPSAAG